MPIERQHNVGNEEKPSVFDTSSREEQGGTAEEEMTEDVSYDLPTGVPVSSPFQVTRRSDEEMYMERDIQVRKTKKIPMTMRGVSRLIDKLGRDEFTQALQEMMDQKVNFHEMARELGCAYDVIISAMDELGIERKSAHGEWRSPGEQRGE